MQNMLLIISMILALLIGVGIAIYFLIPKSNDENTPNQKASIDPNPLDVIYGDQQETVIEVKFKGYSRSFMYSVGQQTIKKGQHVLILTEDGVHCAEVVTDPKVISLQQLSFPPFLLRSIICVADEADLEYYK